MIWLPPFIKKLACLMRTFRCINFSQSVRAVADPVMGKALGDVSLGLFWDKFFSLPPVSKSKYSPNLIFLQKTMMMAEGVARQLNPSANMWQLSRPLTDDWMQSQANVKTQAKQIFDEIAQILSRLPKLINDFEKAQERHAPKKATLWPGQIALLALLIAIISFFTKIH